MTQQNTERKNTYCMENLGCAHCAAKMEEGIAALNGVKQATIAFPIKKLYVVYDEDADVETLEEGMRSICSAIESDVVIRPDDGRMHHAHHAHEHAHGEHCHDAHCHEEHAHGEHCHDEHCHGEHSHEDHDHKEHSHAGHDHGHEGWFDDRVKILLGGGIYLVGVVLLLTGLLPETSPVFLAIMLAVPRMG